MSSRDELLEVMQLAWADVEAIVAGLDGKLDGDGGMENDWQMRDVLWHVALWERVAAKKISGMPLPDGEDLASREPWDLDAFNDEMRARGQAKSDAEVLEEFAAAHQALVEAVEKSDDAACTPGSTTWQAIREDGAGHYSGHLAVIDRMTER